MSSRPAHPPAATKDLAGWGHYPVQSCRAYRPERVAEAAAVYAAGAEASYIPRGLGRSYGDAALNAGRGVVLHERLDRVLAFDPATGRVECEAGVAVADLIDAFLPRGYFLPVTPGTKFVTVGGAVAANVHGKNHHRDGAIVQFVDGFDLLTAGGGVLRCSRTEHADAFWATVGGMGLTGALLAVRLRLAPVETGYVAVDYRRAPNLDGALEQFAAGDRDYQYSAAWIDCLASGPALGRSVLMRGNHAARGELVGPRRDAPLATSAARAKTVPVFFPPVALNPLTVGAFNEQFYARHADGRRIVGYDEFFYPLDAVRHWNRVYGRRGFVQFQCALPPGAARRGLIALLERLARAKAASFLAVLKSFGPGDDGLLSFPVAGHTLALDLPYRGAAVLDLMADLDRITLAHGGRVYLAKDACLGRAAFAAMYPRLGEFERVKARLDPEGRFSSSLSRRLGIGGAA